MPRNLTSILSLLLSFLISGTLQVSAGILLEGRVTCEEIPVFGAAIRNANDSVSGRIAYTDFDGRYSLSVDSLPLSLIIESAGYKAVFADGVGEPVFDVELEREESVLGEVVVTASRFNMRSTPGGFVFDPSEIYSHVRNAAEVMEFVPMVRRDGNILNILAKNKGALILINGDVPSYPQETVLDKLYSLSPTDIKRIEILTNPGVEFTSEEISRGVINIVLEDRYRGANGGVATNLTWSERMLSWIYPSAYGFYQNHNLLLSLYGFYNGTTRRNDNTMVLEDFETPLRRSTFSRGKTRDNSMNVNLSGELRLPHQQALTVSLGITGMESDGHTIVTSTEENHSTLPPGHTETISDSRSDNPFRASITAGIRYRKDLRTDGSSNIHFRIHGQFPGTTRYSDILGYTAAAAGIQEYMERVQSSEIHTNVKSFRTAFNHRFGDGSRLSVIGFITGIPRSKVYTDPENYFRFRSNSLAYQVKINYRKQWSRVFNSQIGLSQWNYHRHLRLDPDNERYSYHASLWLPDISAGFELGGGRHNINLNWRMDFDTPDFDLLNPYRFWTSATEYRTGNPDLGVPANQNLSVSYSFLGNLFLSATYFSGKTINYDYRYVTPEGNVAHSYLETENNNILSLYLSYSRWLFDYRWQLTAMGSASWNSCSSDSPTGTFSTRGWNWMLNLSTQVRISERHRFNWTLAYSYIPVFKELGKRQSAKHDIDTGITKSLWKDAEARASVNIPLSGRNTTYIMPGLVQTQRARFNKDVRINFSFSWRFGKTSIEQADFVN